MALVIDCHEHIINKRGFLNPKGETVVLPEEMVAIMDAKGIDKACVLPLSSPETYHFVQSNEEVFEACDRFPDRFVRFCSLDPRMTDNSPEHDFVPVLEYYRDKQGCRGMGELVANLWWDDPRVQRLLAGCEQVGLPVTFHLAAHEYNGYGLVTEAGLYGLERALARFPRLALVGHSPVFWNEVAPVREPRRGRASGPVGPGGRVPELMRRYANLWGDLSAGSGYTAMSRDPAWGYAFMEEFQDRLMFGLDICLPSNDEAPLKKFMDEAVAGGKISRTAYEKIMGLNAARLYRV
ncbi:MAG TPA: amidohydrolase family protein [Candidatus Brocadiia bacterium]|nr:amidohydrolase family protein [Candidatus Brocadiia bacterium]